MTTLSKRSEHEQILKSEGQNGDGQARHFVLAFKTQVSVTSKRSDKQADNQEGEKAKRKQDSEVHVSILANLVPAIQITEVNRVVRGFATSISRSVRREKRSWYSLGFGVLCSG